MQEAKHEWLDKLAKASGADLVRFLRRRLANARDAHDLAQEVYLRLLRMHDPEQVRNPHAFALRIAANVAYEWNLLARNRLAHSSSALEALVDHSDPIHDTLVAQQMATLEAVLKTLSPKCRAVILLHRRDRLTYQEIATVTGISLAMVKKYLARGIALCQAHLAEIESE